MHFLRKISQDTEKFIFTKFKVCGIFIKTKSFKAVQRDRQGLFRRIILYMCSRFVKFKRLAAAGRFFCGGIYGKI